MTTEEKQEIINAVLSAIRTNSKTITQLTPVTEMSDDDYIELSGGRRVAYPVLMAILDTYVTAEAMTDAMLGTADLDSNQVLDWKQSPIVFLESMGADYDDIDGGTLGFNPNDSAVPVGVVYYSPHSGFQIFEKTGESTFLGYLAKTGVCYVNKNTRRFYMWNGSDMAEIGNNKSMKVVIDDMNCSDLNDIAYEQVVYMPLTKKLVVKVGTRKWWSWTPNTDQLYCDKVNNTTLRWEPSSESFVTIGGGGGMSNAVYDAIKNNIEAIRTNFNSLSAQLANLAFRGANPQLSVDAFTWPSQGGGGGDDTPVVVVPELTSPTNGATVNIGVNTGNGITKNISIKGSNLAKPLTIGVTGTGFTVTPNSVSAANANIGTTVAVTYNGSNTGTATGTLAISSTEIGTVQISLTASYQEQGGGDEPVQTPTISVSPSSLSFNAEAGQSVQKTFTVVGSNLTGNIQIASNNNLFTVSPNSLSPTNGSVNATVTVTYEPTAAGTHSGTITASSTGAASQTVSLNGTATAAASTVNVVYKLLNMSQPSGTTQDQVFGYYKETVDKSAEFNKELTAIQGAALNNDLTVKSGGVVLYKQGGSNNNSGITFSNGELSIASSVLSDLTDDLIIEATACTGTVTVKASESGVTATIGGTTITCSTSNGDGTYSGSASGITSINSMSFSAKTKIVSIDFGGAKFTGSTLASTFSDCTALTQFKGLVVTGSVTSLASLFSGCSALTSFDTIGWDTSEVTTIEALAYNCTALTKVDLGSKDMGLLTSAGTTDSTGAFGKCSNLANFDVSYWNAPRLTSLRAFLYQCTSLTKFDASTWDAPLVANMWGMFASCSALTEIDISGIDTTYANAQGTLSVGHLFHLSQASARNLSKLTIGKFDTSNVATLESFFWYACGEKELELHCKSAVVPSISSDTSKIWFRAGNTSASLNGKQMVGSIYVPTGYKEAYQAAWNSYLSSDTTWHEE